MGDLTYMDCWNYVAPLILAKNGTLDMDICDGVSGADGSGGEEEEGWLIALSRLLGMMLLAAP